MRLFIIATLFLIGTPLVSSAQSANDNFIKIVGKSSQTIQSNGLRVTLELTELERNEYQKVREKSMDEIKQDLSEALTKLGYSIDDLSEVFPPYSGYGKTKQERHTIDVKSENDAKELYKLDIKGLKATGVIYLFPEDLGINPDDLTKKALEDARSKADDLAKKSNKKVGNILNINESNTNEYTRPINSKQKELVVKYNVVVTFELLDQ